MPVENRQRKNTAQLLDGAADGAFQIAFEIFFDQMRDDFGIGLGLEDVAFALQLFFQRKEVFDDAVVNDDDIAGAIAMRVGVLFAGTPMCGPAGMADAIVALYGIEPQDVFEVAKFSGRAADAEGLIVAINGEAGGIVTAVLETLQAIHDDGDGVLCPHISYDSAHEFIVRWEGWRPGWQA